MVLDALKFAVLLAFLVHLVFVLSSYYACVNAANYMICKHHHYRYCIMILPRLFQIDGSILCSSSYLFNISFTFSIPFILDSMQSNPSTFVNGCFFSST